MFNEIFNQCHITESTMSCDDLIRKSISLMVEMASIGNPIGSSDILIESSIDIKENIIKRMIQTFKDYVQRFIEVMNEKIDQIKSKLVHKVDLTDTSNIIYIDMPKNFNNIPSILKQCETAMDELVIKSNTENLTLMPGMKGNSKAFVKPFDKYSDKPIPWIITEILGNPVTMKGVKTDFFDDSLESYKKINAQLKQITVNFEKAANSAIAKAKEDSDPEKLNAVLQYHAFILNNTNLIGKLTGSINAAIVKVLNQTVSHIRVKRVEVQQSKI